MKRIALAVLLALCGARVYGAIPVEQQPQDVTQAQVDELQRVLNDTKSIDAIADQLGLPKEEVKGWFSRHKVITSTAVGTYAVALALSYLTKEAHWNKENGKLQEYKESKWTDGTDDITKLQKLGHYLNHYLKYAQAPVWAVQAGLSHAKEHYIWDSVIAIAAIIVLYEIYQGKDSLVAHLCKKAFGKKAVAEVQAVVEDAKKEEDKKESAPAVVPAAV
ncbi:MAG: homeobox domain-containing protein [Candidatus Babeliales bacterium]